MVALTIYDAVADGMIVNEAQVSQVISGEAAQWYWSVPNLAILIEAPAQTAVSVKFNIEGLHKVSKTITKTPNITLLAC